MKSCALFIIFCLSMPAFGALPGVTNFSSSPDKITDKELSALLHPHVATADVIAIGETVHGSAGLLSVQTRLIRHLVTVHGLRLIVWENPTLRSLELARWVSSCTTRKTPAPIDVLYMPTTADLTLWNWVCEFNLGHPNNPIVFRGMDIWDRPWEHYARLREFSPRTSIDPQLFKNIDAACPAVHASSWPENDAMLGQLPSDGKFLPEAVYQSCRTHLTTLLNAARQAGSDKSHKKESGADEAFELAISASTLLGWLGFYYHEGSSDILSWNERDRAQGRNLMLVMEKHHAARAILTAHTSHVSHNRSRADWWGSGDLKSGVYFFTELTRKKVFNIALTAYEASGTQGHWSLPIAGNSIDKKLRAAGHTFAYFTSHAAFLSEHPTWWMQNQNFPGRYESGVEIIPRDHFDAYFFLNRSHLDQALPPRPMWQP